MKTCGYSSEAPYQGASNEYHNVFPWRNKKEIITFRVEKNVSKKTCLYNVDPFEPHFYEVKLGFTGVYIIFLILLKKISVHVRTASLR